MLLDSLPPWLYLWEDFWGEGVYTETDINKIWFLAKKMHLNQFCCGTCDDKCPVSVLWIHPQLHSLLQAKDWDTLQIPAWEMQGTSNGQLCPGQNLPCRLRFWLYPTPHPPSSLSFQCSPHHPWFPPLLFLHWPSPQITLLHVQSCLDVCFYESSDSYSSCYQLGLYHLKYVRKPKIALSQRSSDFISLKSSGRKSWYNQGVIILLHHPN